MVDIHAMTISPKASLREAIQIINAGSVQIALVVSEDKFLLGVLTDGDVRRAILDGHSLEVIVSNVMNHNPFTVKADEDRDLILEIMKKKRIHQIPVLNSENKLVGLEILDELLMPTPQNNWVVLMAGGLGSRLRPLTNNCPKPMLEIGGKPILERILTNFIDQGFHKFCISVNYLGDQIKSHFGDGSKWGGEIIYVEEKERMGTAGALTLLPFQNEEPIIVMNGDILAKVDFQSMLKFHTEGKSLATMGIRQFINKIPFGVVQIEQHRVTGIVEKPENIVFINSGIYILSNDAVKRIPTNEYYDMPTLFEKLLDDGLHVSGFPVHEDWVDIGRIEDLEVARQNFIFL